MSLFAKISHRLKKLRLRNRQMGKNEAFKEILGLADRKSQPPRIEHVQNTRTNGAEDASHSNSPGNQEKNAQAELSKAEADAVRYRAEAEAYEKKRLAQAQAIKIKQEAKAAKWHEVRQFVSGVSETLGQQYRLTIDRITQYRKERLDKKTALQQAKTAKWREARRAVARFFSALRWEFRQTIKWMKRKLQSNPGLLRRLFTKVTKKISFLLALGFGALLILGIIKDITWIKAFAPVGIVWSLGLPLLPKKSYLARLGKVLIYFPPALWLCCWIVFRLRS